MVRRTLHLCHACLLGAALAAGEEAKPPAAPSEFRVLDGFKLELLAAEPLVTDPVALEYDENGLAYVCEMRDYPYTDTSSDKPFVERTTDLPLGRIRLLVDNDGDGQFDESHVFAEELSWPTGVACWKGGIYVAATPDIWYLRDTDGDRRADVRQRVFTGFRKFNVQAVINNLKWGLDHRIYGAGGTNGGVIRSDLEPDTPPVRLSQNDFRFEPGAVAGGRRFEALSGGSRFGHSFDEWGNRFLCNIRNPVQHVVLPSHYLARNPFAAVRTAIHDAAPAGDTLAIFRTSPPEPWRLERAQRWAAEIGRTYPKSETTGAGYFTSACGVTIYGGSAYPARYCGNAFLADVASNLVHRETLTPAGVTFAAERADPGVEFVTSTDNWFRPVNFAAAPDGTLHVLDMVRETIEHPWSIPDDIKATLDLERGRDQGRIYRLAPPGFDPLARSAPRLGAESTARLVERLEDPDVWWRMTAHRLLFERQDHAAADPLRQLLRDSNSALARLHALWSLAGLGELNPADLTSALTDACPGVREHAVRLAETFLATDESLKKAVLSLADDPDIRVRFQVAFSLGLLPDREVTLALARIARRDGADEWMRAAILSSSADRAGDLVAALIPATDSRADEPAVLLRSLATVVGARNREGEIARVLDLMERFPAEPALASLLVGLGEGARRAGIPLGSLLTAGRPNLKGIWSSRLDEAKTSIIGDAASAEERKEALEVLALAELWESRDSLTAALAPRQPNAVQLGAVRILAGFADSAVAGTLLEAWPTLTPATRSEVLEALLARTERIAALLSALEDGRVVAGLIDAPRKTALLTLADPALRQRAEKVLGDEAPRPRQNVLAEYQPALALAADPVRGRSLFQTHCATCHRLAGIGQDVGPSLLAVNRRTPSEILVHVLDPNREVAPQYQLYTLVLHDGRLATGIVTSETATSITLRRAENVQETIPRAEVDEIAGTGLSLMPEGLEQKLSRQDLADLIAFVLAPAPASSPGE